MHQKCRYWNKLKVRLGFLWRKYFILHSFQLKQFSWLIHSDVFSCFCSYHWHSMYDILCMTFYVWHSMHDILWHSRDFLKIATHLSLQAFLDDKQISTFFFKYRCNVYWCITVFFSRFGIFYLKINFCIQIFRSCLFRWRLSIAIGKAFPCRRDDTNIDMQKLIRFLVTRFIRVIPYCFFLYFWLRKQSL